MLTIINIIFIFISAWYFNGVPGLEWMFPACFVIASVYGVGLGYYDRFKARRHKSV